jgi:hypothetical protein
VDLLTNCSTAPCDPVPASRHLFRLVSAVVTPQREVVVRRRLRRQIVRQVRPLTSGPVLVEDRVHDLPQLVAALMPGYRRVLRLPRGQERADHRPVLVGQIARIRLAPTHTRPNAHLADQAPAQLQHHDIERGRTTETSQTPLRHTCAHPGYAAGGPEVRSGRKHPGPQAQPVGRAMDDGIYENRSHRPTLSLATWDPRRDSPPCGGGGSWAPPDIRGVRLT